MIKKVFVLADIGEDNNKSYHIGDEAMFLNNLRKYKSRNIEVSASSRSISHNTLGFNEVLDIYIKNVFTLFYLIICIYLLRFLKINIFPLRFQKTVSELVSSDLLHISGGGNLNSFWAGHIYYRYLMISLATIFNKSVILTSQTIGPLTNHFHKFLLKLCLKNAKSIGVRDIDSQKELAKLGVSESKISMSIDDAQSFNVSNNKIIDRILSTNNSFFKIGVSVHQWSKFTNYKFFNNMFYKIGELDPGISFTLIPHFFDNKDGFDVNFMNNIMKGVKNNVQFIKYQTLKQIEKETKLTFAEIIKVISSKMQMVISSRYHGLVFALSSNIPVLAINYDNYYTMKNNAILSIYFKNLKKYSVNYNKIVLFSILNKVKYIINNRKQISLALESKNKNL
ncbi:hypothetical protein A2130_00630 [Candidatus Woesebacteria bacterium GWC2_33_12]|uniref:Polysaccharide pyruvyl transferase n=1 Tax=Candidatus Woesebacteria bacterium GW2011_GWB1_33_22 TaxID=1618566 RepID=A0A0F9ZM84_9BACT|nr:MAG: Polysaccharide pyruvyl transferase [Candidatus Woesebacteria bacterium GW2011_GWC2_33_12]KKP42491.1 MAG: Polysaccharide pyruvyl transferase [Candidatus Woesebacteria bacterium GW2011_GWA2_33_20]KKP45234.1 MAG: Polysaccharide pyruvyl transferase [Candidatus Woesebacteria bacterium GW2011_GWB1_33_22]KKP46471.1 MAG: Polysaccharide pyruvyl transferase [Microgenomates group bacterium GW2011_GWC1_33_28]KKP50904.1 MAG: Polysaccharide pyruvyl transferase [Candidatus Woesebacteria bacterium GW20